MEKFVYYVDAITDLHVGAGDINYNIVDKEVEKDPLTNQPIIHASGIKGAIKSHIEKEKLNEIDIKMIESAFGKPANNKPFETGMTENSGSYRFINAYLLSRPLRSCGYDTYVNVTSTRLLREYVDMLNGFGLSVEITIDDIKKIEDELKGKKFICSFDPNVPEKSNIEGETLIQIKEESIIPKLKKLLGGDFAVSSNLEEYALPVIARNNLKDTNLWYEEFVPRHSRFYCVILKTSDCELDIQSFLNEQYIQIGGNASVGYGYCKFELQPKA